MNERVGCREMELLCRHRAALDTQHSWNWLGKAERWKELAHRETASHYAAHPGPMAMGPNTIEGDRRNGQGGAGKRSRLKVAGLR